MKPLHLLLSIVAVACLAAVPLGVTNTYYPVSYTHLDVYKRQAPPRTNWNWPTPKR